MRPRYEVAQILKESSHQLNLTPYTQKIVDKLINCRTSALGGYVYECSNEECKRRDQSYNSCKNRHCPKCQFRTQQIWIKKRCEELLPVRYFHVVMSLPHELNQFFLCNRELLSNILFKSSSKALLKTFDEEYGARTGAITVLHTWGSNLSLHPHVHMIVPAGGIDHRTKKWVSSRKTFLTHVKKMSFVFKATFLKMLRRNFNERKINFYGELSQFEHARTFSDFTKLLYNKGWIVYAKKSFKREVQVLKYLGRYTHRIAISNQRILKVENDQVSFKYKDYKTGDFNKIMTVSKKEFSRRFIQHRLPRGFMRIRHTGFMGNGVKADHLDRIRLLLTNTVKLSGPLRREIFKIELKIKNLHLCKDCHCGEMRAVGEVKLEKLVDTS